jgi:hypothetical protein
MKTSTARESHETSFSIEEQLIKAYHLCLILSQGLPPLCACSHCFVRSKRAHLNRGRAYFSFLVDSQIDTQYRLLSFPMTDRDGHNSGL